MSDVEKAMKIAQRIGDAIVKKFPKHTLYVRRTDLGDSGFIELALRPEGGSYNQEISTAYSDEYFATVGTSEALQEKAKAILRDFKVHFGQLA
jgi:hypothetical protein